MQTISCPPNMDSPGLQAAIKEAGKRRVTVPMRAAQRDQVHDALMAAADEYDDAASYNPERDEVKSLNTKAKNARKLAELFRV